MRDSTSQSQANREEPLDDMVMEALSDTIPVGQPSSSGASGRCEAATAKPAWPDGERGHHLELFVGESPLTALTQHNDTRRRYLWPAAATAAPTCVGQFKVQAFQIDPSRNAADEDSAAPRPPPESFAQQWKPASAKRLFQSPAAPRQR